MISIGEFSAWRHRMSNTPYVSYSLANMIINAFKKSNEVFTISTFTSPARLNFPVSGIGEGWRSWGQRSSQPSPAPLCEREARLTSGVGKLRLKFLKSAGSPSKKGKGAESGEGEMRKLPPIALLRVSPFPSKAGVCGSPRERAPRPADPEPTGPALGRDQPRR